jgi:hypothetical protein
VQASTDQATADVMLPMIFGSVLAVSFSAVGILVVVIQVTWQILILIVPLSFVYYSYQVREVLHKHLETLSARISICVSPQGNPIIFKKF